MPARLRVIEKRGISLPVNDRRPLAKLMTDYVQFKLPPWQRKQRRYTDSAAVAYFMQTDREN